MNTALPSAHILLAASQRGCHLSLRHTRRHPRPHSRALAALYALPYFFSSCHFYRHDKIKREKGTAAVFDMSPNTGHLVLGVHITFDCLFCMKKAPFD